MIYRDGSINLDEDDDDEELLWEAVIIPSYSNIQIFKYLNFKYLIIHIILNHRMKQKENWIQQ